MWKCKRLTELSAMELYQIYKARVEVFVVEQVCPYSEVDEDDLECLHIFKEQDGKVVAYARLMTRADCFQIGRVLVVKECRKQGLARELVTETIRKAREMNPKFPVYAQAEAYLIEFYQSFGFEVTSEIYSKDDQPHIDMELPRSC
ncbi:ElaA protein [Granulicatella balaenopterae]|uniref:ElaA protein n=1 Tax=Granulicatella balaenopterae TaxID=137733 RepID=A0A1H9P1L5_9LACT|nr:GNAT family N-acetyltransferase [Granulicatella balaenopterae]SER41709.1 ElaA protein [Granulicatella balaenopterae]